MDYNSNFSQRGGTFEMCTCKIEFIYVFSMYIQDRKCLLSNLIKWPHPLSCQDPHLIAEILVQSKVDPLPLPQLCSDHPLRFQHYATIPPNSDWPQDLQHYIIALQDLQMTSKIPDHFSVFIILF